METPKHQPLPLSTRLAFWSVAVISLININHFLHLTVGMGWPATLTLAICCVFVCLVVRFPWQRALGFPGTLLLTTLAFYLFIGLGMTPVTGVAWFAAEPTFPLHIGLAALTIVATALGTSVISYQAGVERLLKGTLIIMLVTCTLVLATPLLVAHVYTPPWHLRDLEWIARFRFIGTFADPNKAGVVCCYAVVLALSLLGSSQYRTYAWLVLILGTTAGILTFSRTAIVILAIVFVLFFWFPGPRSHHTRPSAVRMAVVIVTSVVVLLAFNIKVLPLWYGQLWRLKWFANVNKFSDVRLEIWSVALSKIMKFPVLGHGFLSFRHLDFAPKCRLNIPCGSHNSYLMFWGEAGVIPLLLFLFAIGSLLWVSLTLPQSPTTRVVTGWTVVFALGSLMVDSVPFPPWHSFILGLSCALLMQTRRESQSRKSAPRPASIPTKPL